VGLATASSCRVQMRAFDFEIQHPNNRKNESQKAQSPIIDLKTKVGQNVLINRLTIYCHGSFSITELPLRISL
jgi:hypothetical protein